MTFNFPVHLQSLSDRPIFLLSSGQRCGSTLLQRLLNSAPDHLVWGEQNGYLNGFLQSFRNLLQWEERHAGERQIYLQQGFDNFVPNMVPETPELVDAARLHLLALFAVPASRLGKSVWGFKEVRYGVNLALFLQDLFPNARFIHLTRHPVDVFISLKNWEEIPGYWRREWTLLSLENWVRINAGFLEQGRRFNSLLTVRFEEMVAGPGRFTEALSDFLDLPVGSLDRNVFDRRIHGPGEEGQQPRQKKIRPADLDAEEQSLLTQADLVRIADLFGYQIDFSP